MPPLPARSLPERAVVTSPLAGQFAGLVAWSVSAWVTELAITAIILWLR